MVSVGDEGERLSLAELDARLADTADKSHAANTHTTYTSAYKAFAEWCTFHALTPIIPTTTHRLGQFAEDQVSRGMAPATITTRCSAIRSIHRRPNLAGLPIPAVPYVLPDLTLVDDVVRKHRKELARAGWTPRQAEAMLLADLRKIKASMSENGGFRRGIDLRDWAILTLAFALGARRSEISCLDITDIAIDPDDPQWLMVRICFSKTDKNAAGEVIMVKRAQDHTVCAVAAVLAWIQWLYMYNATDERKVVAGPLFRQMAGKGDTLTTHGLATTADALTGRLGGQAICLVYTRRSVAAEIKGFRGRLKRFTGHSGRRGGATEAARAGATHTQMCDHFRWARGSKMVDLYIEEHDQKENNPMAAVM